MPRKYNGPKAEDILSLCLNAVMTYRDLQRLYNALLKKPLADYMINESSSRVMTVRSATNYMMTWNSTPQGRDIWERLNNLREDAQVSALLLSCEEVIEEASQYLIYAHLLITKFDTLSTVEQKADFLKNVFPSLPTLPLPIGRNSVRRFVMDSMMTVAADTDAHSNLYGLAVDNHTSDEHCSDVIFLLNLFRSTTYQPFNPEFFMETVVSPTEQPTPGMVFVTDGSFAGQAVPESEVVWLSPEVYCGADEAIPPCCHVSDEVVTLCDYSTFHGQIILAKHAIKTVGGFVCDDEEVYKDRAGYHELPIPASALAEYNMELLSGFSRATYGCTDSEGVLYGIINGANDEGYFLDHEAVYSEETGRWYRDGSIAEECGLEYDHDCGEWVRQRNYIANYGQLSDVDKTTLDTIVSFGVEVEKEDGEIRDWDEYTPVYEKTGWAKERDGSLCDSTGFEAVSPIYDLLDLTAFNKDMEHPMVKRLVDADYNCDTCGGHFTVSMKGRSSKELLNGLRGLIPLLYALYPERSSQSYCNPNYITALTESPTKYSSVYTKNDKLLEFRYFPAVESVADLKWRVRLMQLAFTKYMGASEAEVLRLIANKKSALSAHLRAWYRQGYSNERGLDRFMLKLCMRYIDAARKYHYVVLELPSSIKATAA